LTATRTDTAPAPRTGTPSGVVLDPDGLLVTRFSTTDRDVVEGARRAQARGAALDAYVLTALTVGAKAIGMAGGMSAVDAVASRIDALGAHVALAADASAARVQAAVERAADERTGTVAVAVREALARLSADVSGLVAGDGGPLRASVDATLRDATGHAAERVERALAASTEQVRAALSPADPAGPFAALRHEVLRASDETRRELGEQLAEVRTLIAVARERAQVMERTAVKGATYEAQVLDRVTDLGHGAGDTVDGTGAETGLVAHAKSGDAIVTVGAATARGLDVRVVVEAKDATLSSERWRRELDAARRNRGAVAALGVVRGAARMPGGRRVHVVDPCNVVVAWDPERDGDGDLLAAAYLLVRSAAVHAAGAGTGDELDRAALAAVVRDAYDSLSGFDAIDRAAGAARRGLDDLTKAADALRSSLHARLARGLRLVSPDR